MELLSELYASIQGDRTQEFLENFEKRFDQISNFVTPSKNQDWQKSVNLAWLILAKLLREASVYPNLSGDIVRSGKLQKRLANALKQTASGEILTFLYTAVRLYPGGCSSNQNGIKNYVLESIIKESQNRNSDLRSNAKKNNDLRSNAALIYAHCCRLGPAGEEGRKHCDAWTTNVEKLLNSIQILLAEYVDPELSIDEETRKNCFEMAPKLDTLWRVETLSLLIEKHFCIQSMQRAPSFPLGRFIAILPSFLVKDCDWSKSSLISLHKTGLELVNRVISSVGSHLAPYCSYIWALLVEELDWAAKTDTILLTTVCNVMSNILNRFGLATRGQKNFDQLWDALKGRLRIGLDENKQSQIGSTLHQKSKVKRDGKRRKGKRKLDDTSGHAQDLFVVRRVDFGCERSALVAILDLLRAAITFLNPFLKAETLIESIQTLARIGLRVCAGNSNNNNNNDDDDQIAKYFNCYPKVLAALLDTLKAAVLISHSSVAPPVQAVVKICDTLIAGGYRKENNGALIVEKALNECLLVCNAISRPRVVPIDVVDLNAVERHLRRMEKIDNFGQDDVVQKSTEQFSTSVQSILVEETEPGQINQSPENINRSLGNINRSPENINQSLGQINKINETEESFLEKYRKNTVELEEIPTKLVRIDSSSSDSGDIGETVASVDNYDNDRLMDMSIFEENGQKSIANQMQAVEYTENQCQNSTIGKKWKNSCFSGKALSSSTESNELTLNDMLKDFVA